MLITMEAGEAVILKVLANCISITDHFLKEVLQGVILLVMMESISTPTARTSEGKSRMQSSMEMVSLSVQLDLNMKDNGWMINHMEKVLRDTLMDHSMKVTL